MVQIHSNQDDLKIDTKIHTADSTTAP